MRRYSIILILLFSTVVNSQSTNQTFLRDVTIRKIENGKVIQEHVRRSQFVYNDKGKLVEKVLFKTPNLKGMSDSEVEEFASGRKMEAKPGIQMIARYYKYKQFQSEVNVTDIWDAHWPAGSRVKVYFGSDFNADLPMLVQALNTWNRLVPEIQFAYAGTAEQTQVCEACLTVARNPTLRNGGTYQQADRGDGLTVYGRIELKRPDRNLLFTTLLHELGHSLGLPHGEGLMAPRLPKGKVIMPSQADVEMVRNLLR